MPTAPPPDSVVDVLVLGGGAAGLFCAATAGAAGAGNVLVLEKNERPGLKILISGGGRCNFTNRHAGPDNYRCGEPAFLRSALAGYSPEDFIALVERHGIAHHEKKLGQLFCDGSSRQIVEMLLGEGRAAGVRVETGVDVTGAARDETGSGGGFHVTARDGRRWRARRLVVATGGLSFPKLGAGDAAHRIARGFGLRVVPPRPGLVPLTFEGAERERCAGLSGVAVPCVARAAAGGPAFPEAMLFTHRGLSGPAILQASSYLSAEGSPGNGELRLDLLPGESAERWLGRHRGREVRLGNLLARKLPARLVDALCAGSGELPPGAANRPVRDLPGPVLATFARRLNAFPMRPSGTEGYAKAEVTLGGVDVRDLRSRTLEASAVPGLFFVGEAVDVTGWLGGYNFQWAWASAYAAGTAAAAGGG